MISFRPIRVNPCPSGVKNLCILLLASALARADLTVTRTFTVNQLLPDAGEYVDVRTLDLGANPISALTVGLNLAAPSGDAVWLGDYYASLGHDTGYAVLLNRIGKTTTDAWGSGQNGLAVTFADNAPNGDIHLAPYDPDDFAPPALTGTWAPDGRETDPALVTSSSPRTALLSSFLGLSASGEWRLFLSDESAGNTAILTSWSLDLTLAPDGASQLRVAGSSLASTSGDQTVANPVEFTGASQAGSSDNLTLAGAVTGSGTLQKTGSGRLVLNNASGFDGAIDVSAGTLEIHSGGSTGSGTVIVNSGGTLAGGGTVGGSLLLSSGAILAPGNSPGTLTVAGDATFAGGSHLEFQIGGLTGGPGTSWDQVVVDGTLILTATAENSFVIDLASLTASDDPGALAGFDPAAGYQWQFLSAADGIVGFDPAAFSINTSAFTAYTSIGGTFAVTAPAGTGPGAVLTLVYTAFSTVPEPAGFALAASLAALVFALARRSRASKTP